jgi:hypothetical protein
VHKRAKEEHDGCSSNVQRFSLCKATHLCTSSLTWSLATAFAPAATKYSVISPCPPNAAK